MKSPKIGDFVAYVDEDLGRQIGQVVRRFRLRDKDAIWCVGGMRSPNFPWKAVDQSGFFGDVTYQIRWERAYPPDLPGSVHSSQLSAISPLEALALQSA